MNKSGAVLGGGYKCFTEGGFGAVLRVSFLRGFGPFDQFVYVVLSINLLTFEAVFWKKTAPLKNSPHNCPLPTIHPPPQIFFF